MSRKSMKVSRVKGRVEKRCLHGLARDVKELNDLNETGRELSSVPL